MLLEIQKTASPVLYLLLRNTKTEHIFGNIVSMTPIHDYSHDHDDQW